MLHEQYTGFRQSSLLLLSMNKFLFCCLLNYTDNKYCFNNQLFYNNVKFNYYLKNLKLSIYQILGCLLTKYVYYDVALYNTLFQNLQSFYSCTIILVKYLLILIFISHLLILESLCDLCRPT